MHKTAALHVCLAMILLAGFVSSGQAQTVTMDWTTESSVGSSESITVDGITSTYTAQFGEVLVSGVDGTGSDPAVFAQDSGNPSVTVSFSEAVNLESLEAFDFKAGGATWTFTPSGGSNSSVTTTVKDASLSPPRTVVNLNWTGINSFTVTAADGASNFPMDTFVLSTPNTAPTFGAGTSTSLTVTEDAAATSISSQLAVDDSDSGQTLTWTVESGPSNGTLSGLSTTASSGGTGIQPSGVTYEPNTDFSGSDSFDIQVSDGTDTDLITVNVTVDNLAPAFNSSSTASFAENGTGTVLNVNADNGGDGTNDSGVAYSITGGTDSGAFGIDASTGELSLNSAPDFENPTDGDTNNDYEVTITADDGEASNNTTTQAITVSVTDVNEAPTLSLFASGGGNAEDIEPPFVVTGITINDDALGSNTLSLSGTDAGAFNINGSNQLEFTATPDYETQSSYSVTVQVDDPDVGSTPDDAETYTHTFNANQGLRARSSIAAASRPKA